MRIRLSLQVLLSLGLIVFQVACGGMTRVDFQVLPDTRLPSDLAEWRDWKAAETRGRLALRGDSLYLGVSVGECPTVTCSIRVKKVSVSGPNLWIEADAQGLTRTPPADAAFTKLYLQVPWRYQKVEHVTLQLNGGDPLGLPLDD